LPSGKPTGDNKEVAKESDLVTIAKMGKDIEYIKAELADVKKLVYGIIMLLASAFIGAVVALLRK
jgi:hypothetical protein